MQTVKMVVPRHTSIVNILRRYAKWSFLPIILLAISFRLWGINFGLPYVYHPDEPVNVAIIQTIFKTGDLNPHTSFYPPLFYHLNTIAYMPYYFIGKLAGVFSKPTDIPAPMMLAMGTGRSPMPTTFLLGRGFTMIFSVASAVLVMLAGWQVTQRFSVGLLAALMMSVSPTVVSHSRFITPDTFLVFFVLLSFMGSVLIFRRGKTWHYVLAGVATGLVAATKYNGALVVLTLPLAQLFSSRPKGLREPRLYLALGASAITFFLAAPAVVGYQDFMTNFLYNARVYSTGHPGMEGNTLNWYLSYLWRVEGPVALLAVIGTIYCIGIRSKELGLLAIFPLIYFVFISNFVVRNDRTLLPVMPFLFMMASAFLMSLRESIHIPGIDKKWLSLAASILVMLSVSWLCISTVQNTIRLTTIDSRETARAWIDYNLPGGSRVALESYSPYVDPQRFIVQGQVKMIDQSPDWYVANDIQYLVFSQGMYRRFYLEPYRYSHEVEQYENLFHAFELVKTFTDGNYEIRIYRVLGQ